MKTLRKLVGEWTIEWEKLYSKGEQKESLEMYIANKVIEWAKSKE